ncbi:histidine phosphatase family protein [Chthonobacter rhizosphaerae]|uniref:histidine phosphatase family protein n=1 Tax=Chthonobacter rhizosphaerae TaxID=2735553 RepID=UPI0015EE3A7A|nr:histidine phosphatase family protein [Chthonobacter rhizosphaerae]
MPHAMLAFVLVVLAAAPARADEAVWAALREPGAHALMRHARAPGTGDPAGFRLGDCATQRNLDETGRAQASRIGRAIRQAGVEVTRVLTSGWCRARETAERLAVGPVEHEPALDSFFGNRGRSGLATEALEARLADLGDEKAVLVTHQVNITALTGIFPASGELIVISRTAAGEVKVLGRVLID